MPIKTIFLDFGNVCATFEFSRFFEGFTRATGVSEAQIRAVLIDQKNHGYSQMFADFECGRIGPTTFFHLLTRELNIPGVIGYRDFAELWTNIFSSENIALSELLDRIPHDKYLLSNTNALAYGKYIARTNIVRRHIPLRDRRILSCDTRVRTMKPHSGIYHYAFRVAGCAPNECVFIDDVEANITAWRALGGHGIVYNAHHDRVDALEQQLIALGVLIT